MRTKDWLKLMVLALPRFILRPLVPLLYRLGLSNRHFATLGLINFPDTVLSGPFRGMRYIPSAAGSRIVPKYLGTYEKELWPTFERLISGAPGFDTFVDVGCAEGYYAVGLTLRLRPKITHAFDLDAHARALLRVLARRNGVDDIIRIHEGATPAALADILADAQRALLIMDCEGAEDDLLLPNQIPGLAKTTLLVEVHETERPGVTDRLRTRFAGSHVITHIAAAPRLPEDLPAGIRLSGDDLAFALDEGRGPDPMAWLFLVPR